MYDTFYNTTNLLEKHKNDDPIYMILTVQRKKKHVFETMELRFPSQLQKVESAICFLVTLPNWEIRVFIFRTLFI